jgi:hypothetical protein
MQGRVRAAEVQMIADPRLNDGFEVVAPLAPTIEGSLLWRDPTAGDPPAVWQLAQWNSKQLILGAPRTSLPSGAVEYSNPYKAIAGGGPPGNVDADLVLTINGSVEYSSGFRAVGDPWATLLLQQSISEPQGHLYQQVPSIHDMVALNLDYSVRLLYDDRDLGPGYDASIYASQFVMFYTIQNLNPASLGYGDYLWFGVSSYDDREAIKGFYSNVDFGGTGKLIYDIGIGPFTNEIVANGDWVTIHGDILPYVRSALQSAWDNGYLQDSMAFSDYYVGAMNMGWEMTGRNDASMQVRDLSLVAVVPESRGIVLAALGALALLAYHRRCPSCWRIIRPAPPGVLRLEFFSVPDRFFGLRENGHLSGGP